jgi:hypothetical protein
MSDLPIWRAAVRADCARIVADLFEPLRMAVFGNPLAVGAFCPRCDTRLNVGNSDRPDEVAACPVCEVAV